MNELRVSKHNDLITSKVNFTLMEHRIFLYGISLINPMDSEEFPLHYEINVQKFAEMFGIDTDRMYHVLKETLADRMFNRSMTIDKEGSKKRRYHLVKYIDYDDNHGTLEIHFDEEIKPFVHQLKNNYTSYHLEQVSRLKSAFSIRFYEWSLDRLRKNKGKPTQFFLTIQEIKERLDIESKYKLYSDLKKRVIEKAITEINEEHLCNLKIRYEEIKKGRSVYQLKLIVKYKKWEKKEHQHTINFNPDLVVE